MENYQNVNTLMIATHNLTKNSKKSANKELKKSY